jgi:hypothetical protein
MRVLADIATGNTDLADVFFLVAFVAFVCALVLRAMAKSFDGVLIAAGAALLALGWLLL